MNRAIDDRFAKAAGLAQFLASADLGRSEDLRSALRLGGPISLWDAVVTSLVVYRFSLLFEPTATKTFGSQLALDVRPYRGLVARFQEFLKRPPRSAGGCTRWPVAAHPVLFVSFTDVFYRDVLQPVAEPLARDGIARVVIVRDSRSGVMVGPEHSVDCHSVWEHWDKNAARVQRNMRARLRAVQHRLFDRHRFGLLTQEVRSALGDVALKHDFLWLFWREFIRLIPWVVVAEHLFTHHRPALVVSADDADPRCRVYSLMARSFGVPSIVVQQGLLRRDIPEFRFLSHDVVAAMGPSSRKELIAQGVSAKRIVVTGQPGFDAMLPGDQERCSIRSELGIDQEQKLVLFASQPPVVGAFSDPRSRLLMIKALLTTVAGSTKITLVVKPHPGENTRDLRVLVGTRKNVRIVDRSRSIVPLIVDCDVFVTFFSTSALQALYAGKPVINLDFGGDEGARMYAESNATWVARNPRQLAACLTAATLPNAAEGVKPMVEARHRFLSELAYQADGRAASRVIDLVRDRLASRETAACG